MFEAVGLAEVALILKRRRQAKYLHKCDPCSPSFSLEIILAIGSVVLDNNNHNDIDRIGVSRFVSL